MPYKGQSFVKEGAKKDLLSKKICFQNGLLHKGMATLAINFSKNNPGKFLIVDPYDINTLRDLVINKIYAKLNLPNKLQEMIDLIIIKMEKYLGSAVYGARSNQTLENLFDQNNNQINCKARIYTQNIEALTTSTKRDGHGMLGKNLIEIYSSDKNIFSVFIRLDKNDIDLLRGRKSKEFQYLLTNPKITVIGIDDLIFTNDELKKRLLAFKQNNLHQISEKQLIKDIRDGFNSGQIKIIIN